jgi:hypothetical protein
VSQRDRLSSEDGLDEALVRGKCRGGKSHQHPAGQKVTAIIAHEIPPSEPLPIIFPGELADLAIRKGLLTLDSSRWTCTNAIDFSLPAPA